MQTRAPGTLPRTAAETGGDDAHPSSRSFRCPPPPRPGARAVPSPPLALAPRRARGARRDPHRRHPLDHRPGRVARHPGRAGAEAVARRDGGREGAASRILNDTTDTTAATKNAQRLINEDKVDLIIGSSVTPTSLAVVETAGAAAGAGGLARRRRRDRRCRRTGRANGRSSSRRPSRSRSAWCSITSRRTPRASRSRRSASPPATARASSRRSRRRRRRAASRSWPARRYNPTDASVTAQVLKIVAANPDAVYIFAAGTPGALPQIELASRGYKGLVYQTQGVANKRLPARRRQEPRRQLHDGGAGAGGRAVAGVEPDRASPRSISSTASRRPTAPGLALAVRGDRLGRAADHPAGVARGALKKARPGTPEFRAALRDAIENLKDFVGSEGVYNMSPADHNGVDSRSQVMVKIENGAWKLQPRAAESRSFSCAQDRLTASVAAVLSRNGRSRSQSLRNAQRLADHQRSREREQQRQRMELRRPAGSRRRRRGRAPTRPCQAAKASTAVRSTLVGIGVPSK